MLVKIWFSLLKANLKSLILIIAAFSIPTVILNYFILFPGNISTGTPSLPSMFANTVRFLYFAILPFAIYRSTVEKSVGIIIANTLNAFKQVFQYLALLIFRTLAATLILLVLAKILESLVDGSSLMISPAVYVVIWIIILEIIRFQLLVVPPMLVATNTDRHTAAKFSRRVTNQPGVFRLFAFIEVIPMVATYLIFPGLSLSPTTRFWFIFGIVTLTMALSSILATALWDMNKNSADEISKKD
jgi:hypothetical protein